MKIDQSSVGLWELLQGYLAHIITTLTGCYPKRKSEKLCENILRSWMPDRKIYCAGCDTYLGVVRDAKLRKGVVFLCKNCEIKRVALEMQKKTGGSGLGDLFGGIFKK